MEQNFNDMFSNMMNDFNFPQPQFATPLNDTNRNHNIPSNPSMRYVNRQLDTIYELLIRYNENMVQYQRNMTQMIALINMNNNSFRQRLHEIRNDRNTPYRNTNTQQRSRFQTYRNFQTNPFQMPAFSTPQNIPLTEQEITTMTTTFTFNNETRNEVSEARCPISLDNFQQGDTLCRINGCNHTFKKDNLLHWFRRNSKCPICRFDLRNAGNNSSSRNNRGRSTTTRNTSNNHFQGFMRDASGNRMDSSNNTLNAPLDEQFTNMFQTFINNTLPLNNLDIGNTENIFDISFNISPLYTTNYTENAENTENVENTQNTGENDSDDESSVIQDNLSVD